MEQQPIRDYNGQRYAKEEGAAIIKELDARTKHSDPAYNSIGILGPKVKEMYESAAKLPAGDYDGTGEELYNLIEENSDDIDAIQANQMDGIVRYNTLTNLNADPSPSTTTRYAVTQDSTESNNGYYSYNGSSFVKDAPFTQQGVNSFFPFDDTITGKNLNYVKAAVLDIELYFDDSSERYYLSYIGNYYSAGGIRRNYLQISQSSNGAKVAGGKIFDGFWTVVAPSTGIEVVELFGSTGAIVGRAVINWDQVFYPAGGRSAVTLAQGKFVKSIIYRKNLKDKLVAPYPITQGIFEVNTTIYKDKPDIFKAIERVELYGGDPSKKYYLKTFAKNRTSNGFYYIIIEEEGHDHITGVAFYNTALVENPSGVNIVNLAESDNSGITGKVWIDWNKITGVYTVPVAYTIAQTQLSSIVHNTSDGFSESEDRIIVGDKLYLVDEDNLQLFKHSILTSEGYSGSLGIQSQFSDYFDFSIRLRASELTNAGTLKIFNKLKNNSNLYFKNTSIQKVTRASVSGKTAELFIFGDSITDGVSAPQAVTPYVRESLVNNWGAAPTFRGLRSDIYANEGRSSWEFAILIGLRTEYSGTVYVTSENSDSSLSKNPFLKVATPLQISTNPEWCFENTPSTNGGTAGVARELNYTESQAIGTYAGDYYTFDFERYVNTNIGGIDSGKKLIVTCALGFNDLNHNGESEQSKNDVLLGMEIFYNRIIQFDADAVVGFAPIIAVNENNNWPAYANLIEMAIKKANELGADIIPVWQHVDRYLCYEFDTSEVLSADNNSRKGTASDSVHPGVVGAKQYANVLSNYIANKL